LVQIYASWIFEFLAALISGCLPIQSYGDCGWRLRIHVLAALVFSALDPLNPAAGSRQAAQAQRSRGIRALENFDVAINEGNIDDIMSLVHQG